MQQKSNRYRDEGHPGARFGGTLGLLIVILIAIAVAIGGFIFFTAGDSGDDVTIQRVRSGDMFRVQRGGFDVTVIASGELAALNQVEIRNPLHERAVITYIVEEGTRVKKGDDLIRFATDEIEEEIKDEELDVLSARNSVAAAKNQLAIQISQNESRLSQAKTDIEIAELALKQWEKEDANTREQLRINLDTAQRNYDRLRERFEDSKELVDKGIISQDEYKRDEISMIEAEAAVAVAQLELEVYEQFQSQRQRLEFESDLQRKKEELERVKKQNEAEFLNAQDDLATKEEQLKIRQGRLAEDREELEKCVVKAPQDGLVVYASSMSGGGWRNDDRSPPQVGTELRRNDFVIALPDVSQMVAEVKVHESLSGQIEPGQRANVVSDVLPDVVLRGTVMSVGVMAETGSWRDPNRRDYTIRILLEDAEDLGLKPSMRAQAEIFVERVRDALYVPVQAIFRKGPLAFVYVPQGAGYAQREVKIGKASELYVQVTEGLEEGQRILLREPQANEVVFKIETPDNEEGRPSRDDDMFARDEDMIAQAEQMNSEQEDPRDGRAVQPGGDPFERFDTNGDGAIERSEMPSQMAGRFDQMDSDGNGSIDRAEMESVMQQFRNRGGAGGQGGREGNRDRDTGQGTQEP